MTHETNYSTLKQRSRSIALMLFLSTLTIAIPTLPAIAKSPQKVFKGDIIISKKRFPRRFKSDKDFIKHMKKADTKKIYANEEGQWEFEYMVFAKKSVGTLQASIMYFDVTEPGTQKLVNTFTFYPADKSDKILNGHASLSASKNFAPHKKYLMVFSRGYRQRTLASTKFVLYPSK